MKLDRKIYRMVELRVQEHLARQRPAAISHLGRLHSIESLASARSDFNLLSPSEKGVENPAL